MSREEDQNIAARVTIRKVAAMTTPTQPADEMAAMSSEEMIEAGYRALVACKPMTSTDCEREACEAIYTAMRALAKPYDGVVDKLAYLEAEARRFAAFYKQGSDGRNTFVIFADKIASLATGDDGIEGEGV